MSQAEPLMPHLSDPHEEVAAADPGQGAPPSAPGTGVGGEDPDTLSTSDDTTPDQDRVHGQETPFRTPDPNDVRRTAGDA